MEVLSYKRNTCSAYDKLKGQILGVFPQKPGREGLVPQVCSSAHEARVCLYMQTSY